MGNHFISSENVDIDLGEGDIVTVHSELAFDDMKDIMSSAGESSNDKVASLEMATPLLVKAIVKWTFKDKDGVAVEVNEKNIKKLKMETVMDLFEKIMPLYAPEKKS